MKLNLPLLHLFIRLYFIYRALFVAVYTLIDNKSNFMLFKFSYKNLDLDQENAHQ